MFLNLLEIKMPLSEAFAVSLIGILTVMIILAAIACLILLVSKIVRNLEATVKKKETQPVSAAAPAAVLTDSSANQGEVELIDTDEKSAAVIMAIVSQKSNIPLNRLSFKSIKLIQDEKKGDK